MRSATAGVVTRPAKAANTTVAPTNLADCIWLPLPADQGREAASTRAGSSWAALGVPRPVTASHPVEAGQLGMDVDCLLPMVTSNNPEADWVGSVATVDG